MQRAVAHVAACAEPLLRCAQSSHCCQVGTAWGLGFRVSCCQASVAGTRRAHPQVWEHGMGSTVGTSLNSIARARSGTGLPWRASCKSSKGDVPRPAWAGAPGAVTDDDGLCGCGRSHQRKVLWHQRRAWRRQASVKVRDLGFNLFGWFIGSSFGVCFPALAMFLSNSQILRLHACCIWHAVTRRSATFWQA